VRCDAEFVGTVVRNAGDRARPPTQRIEEPDTNSPATRCRIECIGDKDFSMDEARRWNRSVLGAVLQNMPCKRKVASITVDCSARPDCIEDSLDSQR
jgi:hypothetical protein